MKKTSGTNHRVLPDGTCVLCKRSGADLKPPCPGYVTAAECGDGLKKPAHKTKRRK